MRWALLLIVWSALLGAADAPPVPDPLDLGERLALIDHLRTAYGIAVPPGEELERLRERYALAWAARHPSTLDAAADSDESARLRRRIADRFQVVPSATATLAELRTQWATLLQAASERDAAEIARRIHESAAAPDETPDVSVADMPTPAAVKPSVKEAPKPARSASGITVVPLKLAVPGVAGAALLRGPKTALCVQFGLARGLEFNGVFESLYASLLAGKGPPDAVFLLGHGSGVSINGAPISDHLRANREFYETFGGTRPATRITCMVIASCSKGSPVQMSAMRDGLGYYPTWRVATAERAYATAISAITAFAGIADRPAGDTFRGIWHTGREPEVVGSVGEVGVDGAKGGMVYFDLPPMR